MKDNLTIEEYIEKLEREDFAENDGLANAITKFNEDVAYRETCGIDGEIEVGIRVLTSDLSNGIFGDANHLRTFDNYLKTDIDHKIASFIQEKIICKLHNGEQTIPDALEALEHKLNSIAAEFKMREKFLQVMINRFYMYAGFMMPGWDVDADVPGDNWKNGIPYFNVIDARKVYLNPGIEQVDMSDRVRISVRENYPTKDLQTLFPDKKDEIISGIISICQKEDIDYNQYLQTETTDAVMMQYRKKYRIKLRYYIDERKKIKQPFLEEDYQQYLLEKAQEQGISEPTPETLKELDKLAQSYQDDNIMTPEERGFTEPQEVVYDCWFMIKFIPQLNILLEEPKYIGKHSSIAIYPGDWHPKRSYPMSMAYQRAESFNDHSIALTILMEEAFRYHRSIPIIAKGALVNEQFVREHIADPTIDTAIIVSEEWLQKNPTRSPREAFQWLTKPQVSQILTLLLPTLKKADEEATGSVPALKGVREASESGAAIRAKQIMARQGDISEIDKMINFFNEVFTILKDNVSKYLNYPLDMEYINDLNDPDIITVNDENAEEPIILSDIAKKCYVEVKLIGSTGAEAQLRENKAFALYDRHTITPFTLNKEIAPQKAKEWNKELKAYNKMLMFSDALQEHPELEQVFLDAINQVTQNKEKPPQVERPSVK